MTFIESYYIANNVYVTMPQVGFDPPGEKWQLCLNIVVALPPNPPRLGDNHVFSHQIFNWPRMFALATKIYW